MAVNEKIQRLVSDLLAATETGRVRWEDTADENTFRTSLRSGMVQVGKSAAPPEEEGMDACHQVSLFDRRGRLIEELTVPALKGWEELAHLFEAARRSARKTDEVLDQILAEIKSGGQR